MFYRALQADGRMGKGEGIDSRIFPAGFRRQFRIAFRQTVRENMKSGRDREANLRRVRTRRSGQLAAIFA